MSTSMPAGAPTSMYSAAFLFYLFFRLLLCFHFRTLDFFTVRISIVSNVVKFFPHPSVSVSRH
jgi:hypothetical protein